jgi:hypothetical protein
MKRRPPSTHQSKARQLERSDRLRNGEARACAPLFHPVLRQSTLAGFNGHRPVQTHTTRGKPNDPDPNADRMLLTGGRALMASKHSEENPKMKRKAYEKELRKLQVELCHLQEWVKSAGARIIILFEGRDAAGKGRTIKAITQRVSPRVFRVVALPVPSDREKSQLFMQRYIQQFPGGVNSIAAGIIAPV